MRSTRLKKLPLIALGLLTACAVNPVTGRPQLDLYGERGEIAMGREADPQIVAQYGEVADAALTAYAAGVGQRLVRVSHRPQLRFTFRVLDDPLVNAFALPGGYVYLTRGILAYLDSEAAMAGVLGHEVGHVAARHAAGASSKPPESSSADGAPASALAASSLAGAARTIARSNR